jgi:hypothetical protein
VVQTSVEPPAPRGGEDVLALLESGEITADEAAERLRR